MFSLLQPSSYLLNRFYLGDENEDNENENNENENEETQVDQDTSLPPLNTTWENASESNEDKWEEVCPKCRKYFKTNSFQKECTKCQFRAAASVWDRPTIFKLLELGEGGLSISNGSCIKTVEALAIDQGDWEMIHFIVSKTPNILIDSIVFEQDPQVAPETGKSSRVKRTKCGANYQKIENNYFTQNDRRYREYDYDYDDDDNYYNYYEFGNSMNFPLSFSDYLRYRTLYLVSYYEDFHASLCHQTNRTVVAPFDKEDQKCYDGCQLFFRCAKLREFGLKTPVDWVQRVMFTFRNEKCDVIAAFDRNCGTDKQKLLQTIIHEKECNPRSLFYGLPFDIFLSVLRYAQITF